jgi:hypothetical protein
MTLKSYEFCIDFRDLNRSTLKDEYPMHVADMLINDALGHRIISFLDGNAGYNQIFMTKGDMSRMAFNCSYKMITLQRL